MSAHAVAAGLLGFIAGLAVCSIAVWVLRDRIKARMIRRRRGQ